MQQIHPATSPMSLCLLPPFGALNGAANSASKKDTARVKSLIKQEYS